MSSSSPSSSGSGSPLSILIIEDIDEMRTLIGDLIQAMDGLRVSGLARNTIEARMELLKRRPALILLDEILPGESAWDFMKEVVSKEKIPVILLTGLEDESRQIPPEALGRLVKPSWDTLDSDRIRLRQQIFDYLGQSKA